MASKTLRPALLCSFALAGLLVFLGCLRIARAADPTMYLNPGPAGEAQVLAELHAHGHSLWGLGHASSATATFAAPGDVRSFQATINTRSLEFAGASHSQPLVVTWDAFPFGEDPSMTISYNESDAGHFTIDWRQRRAVVPGTISFAEDPSDEYDILGGRRHSLVCTVSMDIDLQAFGMKPDLPSSTPSMHLTAILRMLDTPPLADSDQVDALIGSAQHTQYSTRPLRSLDEISLLRAGLRSQRAALFAALQNLGVNSARLASSLPGPSSDPPYAGETEDREHTYIVDTLAVQNAMARHSTQVSLEDVVAAILTHPDTRLSKALASAHITVPAIHLDPPAPSFPDITSRLRVIGRASDYNQSPVFFAGDVGNSEHSSSFYANIWDIVPYGTKLLLTTGNKRGLPPHGAHWVAMRSYDMVHGRFTQYPNIIALQFRNYRITPQGAVLFPAVEEVYEWQNNGVEGLYFSYDASGWHRFLIPGNVVHNYDTVDIGRTVGPGDTIYAAIGSDVIPGSVGISHDTGKTWQIVGANDAQELPASSAVIRAMHFIELGGRWYAIMNGARAIYRIDGDRLIREHVDLFPGSDSGDTQPDMAERDTPLAGGTLYIGADNVYDHQWEPFGLYYAASIDQARSVQLPVPDLLPYDIKIVKGLACVLASRQVGPDHYENYIFTSRDAVRWETALQFTTTALVRSFAVVGNGHDLYFGLGCRSDENAPDSGLLLRAHVATAL